MSNLTCRICFDKLKEPKLCPHCSQVFCKSCIISYLSQKHFCPTCDNYIIDLVDCARLVNEVEEVMNSKTILTLNPKLCRNHNLQLLYFCENCDDWICADCGVIESKHRGHNIINKGQAHKRNKQELKKQLQKLTNKINKIIYKKQKTTLDLQVYRAELKWSKSRIQKYCEQLLKKIEMQGNKQMQELLDSIKQFDQILVGLNRKRAQIYSTIDIELDDTQVNSIRGKLIPQNMMEQRSKFEILSVQKFLQIYDQEDENVFQTKLRKIQTIEEIFPTFVNFTYEFDYQNLKEDTFHYSNYFELWGQDWRLKIYPNGNNAVKGKFLSVFLELAHGHSLEKPKKYIYRIQLLSLNRVGSTIVKEYCSIFQSGQSWGYSDFLNLNHLHEYLHEGKLLFSVGIRNESYEGLCRDLKKYLLKIENENKILEKLLCENSHQISSYKFSKLGSDMSQLQQQSLINLEEHSEHSISIIG